jgi:uncharacterized damage-inducible protein DinB
LSTIPRALAPYYEGWRFTNERLVDTIGALGSEQLALRPAAHMWPIWATVGHVAGARVYWLCVIAGEPGAEQTPFLDSANEGWEDNLDHPRQASELVFALESSWAIVARCLDEWTPAMLDVEFERERDGKTQVHTRQSILMRLITHDASHAGEISQILGMHGAGELDLWTGRAPNRQR